MRSAVKSSFENGTAVRIRIVSRRTMMQEQVEASTAALRSGTRTEVKVIPSRWQLPQVVEGKSAVRPLSFFQNVALPEHGVPFSPLND
jgi:hypothetical protein